MHTTPETARVHNHFKTISDVLFILLPSGFPNDKLAISDCKDDEHSTTDSRRGFLQNLAFNLSVRAQSNVM